LIQAIPAIPRWASATIPPDLRSVSSFCQARTESFANAEEPFHSDVLGEKYCDETTRRVGINGKYATLKEMHADHLKAEDGMNRTSIARGLCGLQVISRDY
jgi:hypothetical protein